MTVITGVMVVDSVLVPRMERVLLETAYVIQAYAEQIALLLVTVPGGVTVSRSIKHTAALEPVHAV